MGWTGSVAELARVPACERTLPNRNSGEFRYITLSIFLNSLVFSSRCLYASVVKRLVTITIGIDVFDTRGGPDDDALDDLARLLRCSDCTAVDAGRGGLAVVSRRSVADRRGEDDAA